MSIAGIQSEAESSKNQDAVQSVSRMVFLMQQEMLDENAVERSNSISRSVKSMTQLTRNIV